MHRTCGLNNPWDRTFGRCHNWIGIPGIPPHVTPKGSSGWSKKEKNVFTSTNYISSLSHLASLDSRNDQGFLFFHYYRDIFLFCQLGRLHAWPASGKHQWMVCLPKESKYDLQNICEYLSSNWERALSMLWTEHVWLAWHCPHHVCTNTFNPLAKRIRSPAHNY